MIVRVSRTMAVLLWAALASFASACRGEVTAPSQYAPFSQTDLVAGTGDPAQRGQLILVDYTGWLYDSTQPEQKGAVFDSSEGRVPFSFTLGFGEVIEGWDEGLVGMKIGGIRRLVLPPSKAYGDTRTGLIPPNATLVFEVELLGVQ